MATMLRQAASVIPDLTSSKQSQRPADVPTPSIHHRPLAKGAMDGDAAKVIRRLRQQGFEAYLVGGGVRDLLLGKTPKDFDIATSAEPGEVRRIFRNCRVIGRRFRLAHILFGGGKIIEVATFRKNPREEPLTNHASKPAGSAADTDLLIRNDNVFGEPHEDATRRDFTINGLFYDIESSEVIDYVGGMEDLDRRIVRMIGPADIRIEEDPIRILRAIKFSARLDLGIAPDLLDAMVAGRETLKRAAKARLLEEIFRLLRGGAAERSYYLAWETGVLSVLLPELSAFFDDGADTEDLTWRRLTILDQDIRGGAQIPDSALFATLLLGPALEALSAGAKATEDLDEFLSYVFLRLVVPRRTRDRMRAVLLCQRRFGAGKWSSLKRRDFFAEAAWLYSVDCRARGRELPPWIQEAPKVGHETPRQRRPRRPRRRPPQSSQP